MYLRVYRLYFALQQTFKLVIILNISQIHFTPEFSFKFWRRHQHAGESLSTLTCEAWLAYESLMHYKTK